MLSDSGYRVRKMFAVVLLIHPMTRSKRSSISRDVKGPLCIIIEYMTDNCVAEVDNAAAMI